MRCNWFKSAGAGVVIACLVVPLTAQGAATKAELQQKSQQHRALTAGKMTPKAAAVSTQTAKQEKKALHTQKSALIKERRALAKQGNRAALDANRAKIASVDVALNDAKKGGAKK